MKQLRIFSLPKRRRRLAPFFLLMTGALLAANVVSVAAELTKPLNRQKIVARHVVKTDDPTLLLPVGNGNLCFNVDGTGLQTFKGDVLSHWGWFSTPLPSNRTWKDVTLTGTYWQGRLKGQDPWPGDKMDLYAWHRQTPSQMNLARVQFVGSDGKALDANAASQYERTLDPWTGIHQTSFVVNGEKVAVTTCIGDDVDLDSTVAIKVNSALLASGALSIAISVPYPDLTNGPWTGDFSDSAPQTPYSFTVPSNLPANVSSVILKRDLKNEYNEGVVGDYSYAIRVDALGGKVATSEGSSSIHVDAAANDSLELTISFDGGDYSEKPCDDSLVASPCVSFSEIESQSRARWEKYWNSGAAIDLSGSSDPRWFELERRIVLSQFLMGVNATGSWPCSESGLLAICPWSGRFHMEMVWWHMIHWWSWNRVEYAQKSIRIFDKIKDGAKLLAEQLDYQGYKWQKEVAPDGRTAPWNGNLALLWKQPHPIYFAEMDYLSSPTRETLEKWADIVEGTAVHMADFATKDDHGVYHLDPAMPPSEVGFTRDDLYDLEYWRWGLDKANQWRERLGKDLNPLWAEIVEALAPLPQQNGVYVRSPEWLDTFENWNWEHPDLVGIYGVVPPTKFVDKATAERTLERVLKEWQWDRTWGWDYPMAAMGGARLGRPDLAIEALFTNSSKNVFNELGVNLGGPSRDGGPGPYLPGNGGLLHAVAGMCVGFAETEGNAPLPKSGDSAPGFPEGWNVKWEGFSRPL